MIQKMKVALAFLCASGVSGYAQGFEKRDCSSYEASGSDCSACFDGGRKAVGAVFAPFDTFAAGDKDRIYFADENEVAYNVTTLNSETTWFTSNNLLRYPEELEWFTQTSTGRNYLHFSRGSSQKILETPVGKGIKLTSKNDGALDDRADLRFEFFHHYRDLVMGADGNPSTTGSLKKFTSCIFFHAAQS